MLHEGEPEEDDRNKASRWQIGSQALIVLEQVYTVEPFPSLDTRRELSRKLNVSARQVQVWFQNKRQRERKLSRSKGMFSTPGLPDTPAATAALVAAKASTVTSTGQLPTGSQTFNSAGSQPPQVQPNAQFENSMRGISLPADMAAPSPAAPSPANPRAILPPAGPPVGLVTHHQAPFPMQNRIAGRKFSRSTSLNEMTFSDHALGMPSSLDDNDLPLGLVNHQEPRLPPGLVNHQEPQQLPLAQLDACKHSVPRFKDAFPSSFRGNLTDISSMPWFSSLPGSLYANTEQVETHCRAAVAAAAAAMGSGASAQRNPLFPMNSLTGLPMLQTLLSKKITDGPATSSRIKPPQLSASLPAALGNATCGAFEPAIDDLGVEDLPADMQQQLLQAPPPMVGETISTLEALSQDDVKTGGLQLDRGCSNMKLHPALKRHPAMRKRELQQRRSGGRHSGGQLDALPLKHSGVSGLLDSVNLSVAPSEQEVAISKEEPGLDISQTKLARTQAGPAQGKSAAENTNADTRVQVITSAVEPYLLVWASQAWLDLCGFKESEVLGKTLDIIQGPLTSRSSITKLMDAIRAGETTEVPMINHTRSGAPFSHLLRVEPLRNSQQKVMCVQATSDDIEWVSSCEIFSQNEHEQQSQVYQQDKQDKGSLPRSTSDLKINEMLDLFCDHMDSLEYVREEVPGDVSVY